MKHKQFYYCRGCNAKNKFDRKACIQCGRDMKDRMERAYK